jgi:hypothetical protein
MLSDNKLLDNNLLLADNMYQIIYDLIKICFHIIFSWKLHTLSLLLWSDANRNAVHYEPTSNIYEPKKQKAL